MPTIGFVLAFVVSTFFFYWFVMKGVQHLIVAWIGIVTGFLIFVFFAVHVPASIWGPTLLGLGLGGFIGFIVPTFRRNSGH